MDTPAYLALVAQGRYAEGLAIHRERNPFPLICGRACPAFCETKCRRGELDEPIAIRLVKRFMADQADTLPWTARPLGTPTNGRRPPPGKWRSSAPARRDLPPPCVSRNGLFASPSSKSFPVPGGMMSWAIPEYRLPRKSLLMDIEKICNAGRRTAHATRRWGVTSA